jgi:cerevisin
MYIHLKIYFIMMMNVMIAFAAEGECETLTVENDCNTCEYSRYSVFSKSPSHHEYKIIPNEYIVRLKTASGSILSQHIDEMKLKFGNKLNILHAYHEMAKTGLNIYSAHIASDILPMLQSHPGIETITPNSVMQIAGCVIQSNPEWGISRTSKTGMYTNGNTYEYMEQYSGEHVDVYILDTGIYCEHDDFTSKEVGSCTYGWNVLNNTNDSGDDNGHGTHVAAIVAGHIYGIAKKASVISVRICNAQGDCTESDAMAGLDWALNDAYNKGVYGISLLSVSGSYSDPFNEYVNDMTELGLSVVVPAGNNNANACFSSPSSASNAIVVGATEDDDDRWNDSNYGSCLTLFGPGEDIVSAWIGDSNSYMEKTGTSMAAAHVAGVAAKYQSENSNLTPHQLKCLLIDKAERCAINCPSGDDSNVINISPNYLVSSLCTCCDF